MSYFMIYSDVFKTSIIFGTPAQDWLIAYVIKEIQ